MKKTIILFSILMISSFILVPKQSFSQANKAQKDTTKYGKTPTEYRPYSRFTEPYKQFFVDMVWYIYDTILKYHKQQKGS